ncbi:hypothetical protein [uncultured Hymenobacter sp.]|uniref:hypothetical protein n=1 Tax=uncultured Hymenobacter sp. TaxID=170016 RepID=UPI0035CB98B3
MNPEPDPTPDPQTEPPVPTQGNGIPDYSQVHIDAEPEAPIEEATGPGGSATEAESGGGYSG